MLTTPCFHVDVFASQPLTGNGLAVFLNTEGWSTPFMQAQTQEMRQFESIFLSGIAANRASARVFTAQEELPFAGHPVLGAAAVLHRCLSPLADTAAWVVTLPGGDVTVRTDRLGTHHLAAMNQGVASCGSDIEHVALQPILMRLGLRHDELVSGLPARVISTGLAYLVLPVSPRALSRASISGTDLEHQLAKIGAKFVLLLDVQALEMRTWDNLGRVEDVATGSAAGPAAHYLMAQGLADAALPLELAQGRFAGRPSKIRVWRDAAGCLWVSGHVWPVSHGQLELGAQAAGA